MKTQRGKAAPPEPWANHLDFVPGGFKLMPDGVFADGPTPLRIADPCWVSEQTHSPASNEWGRVIHWLDPNGDARQQAFPDRLLHERSFPLAGILRDLGLMLVPGEEKRLMRYLGSWRVPHRLLSVARVGWHEIRPTESAFVLPNQVIGGADGEIVYQPEHFSPTLGSMRTSGSLRSWQDNVAKIAADHPLLYFALCSGFAGPLLRFAGADSGGFNLVGASSRGKTTALGVAASIWGAAGDPGATADPYIQTWNQTLNGFEGTAAAHNDLLLVLDELGQCDPFELGRVAYALSGGQGRQRMNRQASLAARNTWRLLLLSSGEVTIADKLAEVRQKAHTGQLVRIVDIPIGEGLFNGLDRLEAEALARRLKESCARHFGHAGPAFVRALIETESSQPALDGIVHRQVDDWAGNLRRILSPQMPLAAHQMRALRRFAIVAVAGEFAMDAKVLPVQNASTAVRAAVETAALAWLQSGAAQTEGQKALDRLSSYIRTNAARFIAADASAGQYRGPRGEIAGYWTKRDGQMLWLLDQHQLEEACRPFSRDAAIDEARRRGGLFQNESDKLKSRHQIHGHGRVYLYAFRQPCLDALEPHPS